MRAQLNELEGKVLNTTIRRTEAIGQASVSAEPIHTYKPGSTVINDYKALAKEVIARVNV